MTLDEAIDRLIDLRRVVGNGDIPFTRIVDGAEVSWETAAIEIQNVLPESNNFTGFETWRCGDGMVNTKQIISVF